jgi:C4-dicarboxylate-specific signal transduction histidine kinase
LRDIAKGRFDKKDVECDLHDVINQVNKMADIIEHMRIFTRRSEGKSKERIDINSLVNGTFKLLGQQLSNHNTEVRKELSSDLPQVVGDPVRLEQVFLNLVSNARHAVESSGKEHMKIEVRTYAANTNGDSSVVMEVKDNGDGIQEELRGKILQPFFTTKDPGKGTGLGLSVSNKIIEEHNGKMELDSTVGEGSIFRVILPAME